jgi:hypothetical protein
MKTVKLQTGSEALRRRRTPFAIARIEIRPPLLKSETSFMSNSRRINQRIQLPREFCLTLMLKSIFFRRQGRQSPKIGLDGKANGREQDRWTGSRGRKTSGF